MEPPDHSPGHRQPNHLAGQTSPYLLQHLYNPVDWRPWGPEALEAARREDKPIFLSIGYAACHWCHVMERESFENTDTAALLNTHFVPIKVDREERPDLDDVYMNAVQILTGAGGWPLNVFLTPGLEPFYGGTYFPPDERYGRPSFPDLLVQVAEVWRARRTEIERSAAELTGQLRRLARAGSGSQAGERPGREDAVRAAADLAARFDPTWGGFGGPPKFPPHGSLALLLREHDRTGEPVPLTMARRTLDAMARGGMYDQIGGGFARYSVDERWLVPHFEKMLYDQALVVPVYVDAWLLTGRPLYRGVVFETLDFVRRELTHPEGGLYSSLDADSEGHEGRFYVWGPEEVDAVLGTEDGALVRDVYGIEAPGNFEGKSIPNLLSANLAEHAGRRAETEEALALRLRPLRARLLAAREARVRPPTDDKVLTAWNGLMITAFARAFQAFGREEDLRSARRAADFVQERLVEDGSLCVTWRAGVAGGDGFLDDHAFFARGLLDLYESSFERRDLDASARLARLLVERFEDPQDRGFFFTSATHETLPARNKSHHDGALPSGSGVACELLLRLALHLDDDTLRQPALATLAAYRSAVARMPTAHASLLAAADLAVGPTHQIAFAGPREHPATQALLGAVRGRYLPRRVLGLTAPGEDVDDLPLLRGKVPVGGRPAAYVCRDYACEAPVVEPEKLAARL